MGGKENVRVDMPPILDKILGPDYPRVTAYD